MPSLGFGSVQLIVQQIIPRMSSIESLDLGAILFDTVLKFQMIGWMSKVMVKD